MQHCLSKATSRYLIFAAFRDVSCYCKSLAGNNQSNTVLRYCFPTLFNSIIYYTVLSKEFRKKELSYITIQNHNPQVFLRVDNGIGAVRKNQFVHYSLDLKFFQPLLGKVLQTNMRSELSPQDPSIPPRACLKIDCIAQIAGESCFFLPPSFTVILVIFRKVLLYLSSSQCND